MISKTQIEADLVTAMKAKDQLTVEVLRGLKTRIQNEMVAKIKQELSEEEIIALIRSEVKRRKEAVQTYEQGGRKELAEKELAEAGVLQKYLPAQMSEQDLVKLAEQIVAENNFVAADFGKAMQVLKTKVGNQAEGALLAKTLKEKLK